MSRKVFEYFFDPDDLEPFYSELPRSLVEPKSKRENRASDSAERVTDAPSSESANPSEVTASAGGDHQQRAGQSRAADRPTDDRNRMQSRRQSRHEKETSSSDVRRQPRTAPTGSGRG